MKTAITVFLKECLDGIRDIRSVFISWIMPLFLFPLIVTLLSLHTDTKQYVVGVDALEGSLREHLEADSNLVLKKEADDKALLEYSIDAKINEYSTENLSAIEISFNSSVRKSIESLEYLKGKITEYKVNRVMNGDDVPFDSIVVPIPVDDIKTGASKMILFSILPVMLLIIAVTSPIALASEIIAGEKEKNSLELLLITSRYRISVLIGKYAAIFTFGLVGILTFLSGVTLSFYLNPEVYGITSFVITPAQIVLIGISVILLCAILSGVETVLSLYARTAKESQLYIVPLTILCISLSTFSETFYFSSSHTNSLLYWIPLLNIIHFLRDVIMLDYAVKNLIPLVIVSALSSAFLLAAAGFMIRHEKIIYRG